MGNAKKSLSSYQLARDLELNQKTAWYMETRIRAEMGKKGSVLLKPIIEEDETSIDGKPRKQNKRDDDKPSKRGHGTDKRTIIEVVERGGKVMAQMASDLIRQRIQETVQVGGAA